MHFVPSPERFSYEDEGITVGDGDLAGYHRPEVGNIILVGSEDPDCDKLDWIPIYDKSDLDGFYLAIGTSGNQYKNGPDVTGNFRCYIFRGINLSCQN
ncbi:MAG: hypothetical protein KKE12_08220 [Proteobacteria bacterium]|nr:hypothetical protein [Pseudomonadota bacterium]